MSHQIIRNLSSEEYHHGDQFKDFISSTQLKNYLKSPRYYAYMREQPKEQTDAQKFGSLFHSLMECLVMAKGNYTDGVELWNKTLAIFSPPINEKTGQPYGTATKAYKDAMEDFFFENAGATITNPEEARTLSEMAYSMLCCCGLTSLIVRKLMQWGKETETSFFWRTEEGIGLKIRPDLLTATKLIDWKTINADTLDEDTIARTIVKYRYDISLSMYQYVLNKITGRWYTPYLVFVTKSEPYDCVVVDMSEWCYAYDAELDLVRMEVGAIEFQRLLNLHTECVRNNEWPGSERTIEEDDKIMRLKIPSWFSRKYETE